MHSARSIRRRWTSLLGSTGLVVGAGGLALFGIGATAVPQASTALQLSVRANHLTGLTPKAARGQASLPATSPCWASSNWSGYAVATTSSLSCQPSASFASFTSVGGTWTVPTLSATSGASYSAAWLGIDGFNNGSLIQTGTEQDYYSRGAHYGAWWTTSANNFLEQTITAGCSSVSSGNSCGAVSPGDQISASISGTKGGTWAITLTDSTNLNVAKWSFREGSIAYTGPGSSAEWIVEAPGVNGRTATLAHYGSTTFSALTVNSGDSPSLVAGDGGELVQGNFFRSQVVSIPSAPANGDEFAIAYGSTAPPVP